MSVENHTEKKMEPKMNAAFIWGLYEGIRSCRSLNDCQPRSC